MKFNFYQGYLETYNLELGFVRDEYCFVEIAPKKIKFWIEDSLSWAEYHGNETAEGHFEISSLASNRSAIGMLHRSPGYDEFEGHIEYEDAMLLIHIELVRKIKNKPALAIKGKDDL